MKKRKRDMFAMEKTKAYFLQRDGKPTTVTQAARDLKVPATRLHTRASQLVQDGVLTRVGKGVYVSSRSLPQPVRVDANEELLQILLKDREHLDTQIEKVRSVIELQKQRGK